ncbi:alpha carbonic anhydrase 7-like [Oryza brachyantha]|uniref:alpha carbonic anhydrase 7-like n=1 Tax=Oryza brachyantha TaxID=4533 RepID=UPI0003EAB8EA|nr:alpha carbonic anhydrase 7-like [Oryza brachyantha]
MVVSCRAAVVLLVAASSLAVVLAHTDGHEGPEFTYISGAIDGPENWGKLSPEYKLCGDGKSQSPIDISTQTVVPRSDLESLERTYAAGNATLINNGKDITMKFEGKVGEVSIMGKVYGFHVIHWHAPSEHTINGKRFPLELHLVHKCEADGSLAVISVLYKIGAPDSFYLQLKDHLAELGADECDFSKEDSHVAAGVVQLRSLQKRTGSYFRYVGSLTTPPCSENVVWNVLGKVREIGKEQLDLIMAPLPSKDARPAQPLNGRTVFFYNPPNTTVSFQEYSN